ncbi:MAG TPA: heparinase II/III family protein [Vineibacter sp.]|nr:heparinase II/III family protein [Vineibacter sp.]
MSGAASLMAKSAASAETPASPAAPARPAAQIAREAWYRSSLYALLLGGSPPSAFLAVAPDDWPGDAAAAPLSGELQVGAHRGALDADAWRRTDGDPAWLAGLHGFDWLRDLRVLGGVESARLATDSVEQWITAQARWSAIAWRDDVLAVRIVNWVRHYDFLAKGTEPAFTARLVDSLSRQRRHLETRLGNPPAGRRWLAMLKAAIIVDAAFVRSGTQHQRRLARSLTRLAAALPKIVLADGTAADRSPRAQLAVLRDLIDIRDVLASAERPAPQALQDAIDRAAPLLRFLCHGDGGMALFNGADIGDVGLIEMVLERSGNGAAPPLEAPQGGFARLAAGPAVVLMDAGAPPGKGFDIETHAGTLSAEFSFGDERIFGNCGAYPDLAAEWRFVVRYTAAHATAIIADTNSSELIDGGGLEYPAGNVNASRAEQDGAVWVEASHDGYRTLFGVTHKRRLWLAADGADLRGEDTLAGPDGKPIKSTASGRKFAIRFHLHPDVKASLAQSGASALLRLPSGQGWKVRASGATMTVADSVWLGDGQRVRRTAQIALVGGLGPEGAKVKWAFTRVDG